MAGKGDKSIEVGDIPGTGIAVGHGARSVVTITQQSRDEVIGLLETLCKEIKNASIPDSAKNILLNKAVPEMDQAIRSADPKSGWDAVWNESTTNSKAQVPLQVMFRGSSTRLPKSPSPPAL